jgi:hypothetical protein
VFEKAKAANEENCEQPSGRLADVAIMNVPAAVGSEPRSNVDDETGFMPTEVGKLSRDGVSMASNSTPVVADTDEQEVVEDEMSDGQSDAERHGQGKLLAAIVSPAAHAEAKKTVRWLTGPTSSDWNGQVSV